MTQPAIAGEGSFLALANCFPQRLLPKQSLHGRMSTSAGHGPHSAQVGYLPAGEWEPALLNHRSGLI